MPTHAELCAGSKILHSKGKTVYLEGLSESCQINSMCLETIQKTEISIRTVKEQSSSWRNGKACGKSKQKAVFSCDAHVAFSLKSQDPGMHQIQGKNRYPAKIDPKVPFEGNNLIHRKSCSVCCLYNPLSQNPERETYTTHIWLVMKGYYGYFSP